MAVCGRPQVAPTEWRDWISAGTDTALRLIIFGAVDKKLGLLKEFEHCVMFVGPARVILSVAQAESNFFHEIPNDALHHLILHCVRISTGSG